DRGVTQDPGRDGGNAWQQAMDTYAAAVKVFQSGFAAAAAAASERMSPGAARAGRPPEDATAGDEGADSEAEGFASEDLGSGADAPADMPFRQGERYDIARVAEQLESLTARLDRVERMVADVLAATRATDPPEVPPESDKPKKKPKKREH